MDKEKQKYILPVVKKSLGLPLLLAGKDEKVLGECLNLMVSELAKNTSPAEFQFSLYDGGEPVFNFAAVSGHCRVIHTTATEAIRELEWANAEMARRYEMLSQAKCRTLNDYNKAHADATLPRIVIVIHELGDLMEHDAARTEKLLVKLLARSLAIGIHVICSTTRLRADVLTLGILTNFGNRLVFRTDSQEESQLLGIKIMGKLPKCLLPYRGNPATTFGREVDNTEKECNAAKLEENEAVFLYHASYLDYENGRGVTKWGQRRRLVRI